MRTARRLSAILVTTLFAVLASPAGDDARTRVAAAHDEAAPPSPRDGVSIEPRAQVRSPWAHGYHSQASRDHAERDKTFAWLLLLLREHRGAR